LKRIRNGEENVRREIEIMRKLNHPNIVRIEDVIDDVENEKLYVQSMVLF